MERLKRNLIVSGCSYTEYAWPTWADYLAAGYDTYYNLGASGAGNKLIFNKLMHAYYHGLIKKEDTVVIQWSSLSREDRVLPGTDFWTTPGCINYQDVFDNSFITKYYNPLQTAIELISYIQSADLALRQIGCEYLMLNMFDWHIENFLGEPSVPFIDGTAHKSLEDRNVLSVLKSLSTKYIVKPSIEEFAWEDRENLYVWAGEHGLQEDVHPSPLQHYNYTCKYIIPKLNRLSDVEKSKISNLESNAKKWTNFLSNYDLVKNYKYSKFDMTLPTGITWPSTPRLGQGTNYNDPDYHELCLPKNHL